MDKRVPEVRFKGFTDDWEQHEMKSLFQISSAARVHKGEWSKSGIRFLRSSDIIAKYKGTRSEKLFIPVDLYHNLIRKSGKTSIGDVLITGGGSVGIPYLVDNNDPIYFKDADVLWLKNENELNGYFLYTYFLTPRFKKYIKKISHVGTISHYTIEQVEKTPIMLPRKNEQFYIGNILKELDNCVTLYQQQLSLYKKVKKSLLQTMFPKDREKAPKVRFADFHDDWEQHKLKRFLSIPANKKITVKSSKDLMTVKLNVGGIVSGGNRDTLSLGSTIYYERHSGQLIYGKQNFFNGSMAIIPKHMDGKATSGDVPTFDISNDIDRNYLFDFISRHDYWKSKESLSNGTGSKRIHESTFLNFDIIVPPNFDEQSHISKLYKLYDELIDIEESKLKETLNLRKYFLQKLFI